MTITRKIIVCLALTTTLASFAAPAIAGSTKNLDSSVQRTHSPGRPGCPLLKPGHAYVGRSSASKHQRHVINVMLQRSSAHHASFRVQVSILAAAMQESRAQELPYGTGTSVGPLQLISSHGTAAQRIRADFSADWYLPQAIRIDSTGQTIASIAVRVQRPRDTSGYVRSINKHWKASALLDVRNYRKGCQS